LSSSLRSPSSGRSSNASLHRYLIGQIKKNQNYTLLCCASPRVSGQTGQQAISSRCPNIGLWMPCGFNTTKLALFLRRKYRLGQSHTCFL
jgi:hypothetical protein